MGHNGNGEKQGSKIRIQFTLEECINLLWSLHQSAKLVPGKPMGEELEALKSKVLKVVAGEVTTEELMSTMTMIRMKDMTA